MGRPTKRAQHNKKIGESVSKMTPEVINKLKEAFAIDPTIKDACAYAEIGETTYYRWMEENPVLREELERMRSRLPLKSHQNIASHIHQGDVGLSKWYLERRRPELFAEKLKIEQTTPDDEAMDKEDEAILAEYEDKIYKNLQKRMLEKSKKQ